jgi:hypothetical protein
MKLCAEVLLELKNSSCHIIEAVALSGESQHEMMYNEDEARCLSSHEYAYSFGEDVGSPAIAKITEKETPMNRTKTKQFVKKALAEMSEWM